MNEPPISFHPGPLSAGTLNRALSQRVREVVGDGVIQAQCSDNGTVTLRLSIEALLRLMPLPIGVLTLTGSASRFGVYTARTLRPPKTALNAGTASTIAASDFGDDPGSNNAYLMNVREVGKSTHDLASSSFLPLTFLGRFVNFATDNKPVYAFDGFQWEDCS